MALTKVSRGLLTTSIVDNGNDTAITIDSNENVGIGGIASNFSGYTTLNLNNATNGGLVTFENNGTVKGYIYNSSSQFRIESETSTPLVFANANGETMRIDSSGNVGIGVTPEAWNTYTPLQVQLASLSGFTNGDSRLSNNAYYAGGWKYINSIPATQYLMDASNGLHTWSTAASGAADSAITWQEHFRIDSSGNVGIGGTTTTGWANKQLVLDAGASASAAFVMVNDTTGRAGTDGSVITLSGSDMYLIQRESANMIFRTANTERLRIASDGSISIPNQNAINELTFTGTEFTNVVSATTSGFQFGTTGAGYLAFLTNNQPRATIDSVGNLLVGKTNTGDYVTGIEMQPAGAILSYRTSGVASIFGRTDSGEITRFTRGGAIIGSVDVDATGYIAINARTGTGRLQVGGVTRYNWDANQFYPQQDNVRDLGYPNLRWDDVYSTGGINTSDRNEKQDIEELSNAEQRVAVACKGLMRKFRWKSAVIDKGDDARIHVGIMAQDLQAAFESEGLDPARYGMWCSNTWTDEETGEEITRMSVRYNELLAFIISAT